MPTGYTAAVVDGSITELEPFVWQLARGMGALIMMRDEPHDAPVPERFKPSDYHMKKLVELRAERDRIRSMTDVDANLAAMADAAAYDERIAQYKADKVAQRERYQAMIAKVEAWQGAPEGIKEFGLEQLRSGMDFDCSGDFSWYEPRPSDQGAEWRSAKLEKIAEDIQYSAAECAKEDARTEERNAWLAHLRRSLAQGGEAGTAETHSGSVHEHPVPAGDAS